MEGTEQDYVNAAFTENWIARLHLSNFDDLYTIGSEFASRTRSHTPFPAVSAKNAVFENLYWQNLQKFTEKFRTIFAKIHYTSLKKFVSQVY